jgi:hypothetical protein
MEVRPQRNWLISVDFTSVNGPRNLSPYFSATITFRYRYFSTISLRWSTWISVHADRPTHRRRRFWNLPVVFPCLASSFQLIEFLFNLKLDGNFVFPPVWCSAPRPFGFPNEKSMIARVRSANHSLHMKSELGDGCVKWRQRVETADLQVPWENRGKDRAPPYRPISSPCTEMNTETSSNVSKWTYVCFIPMRSFKWLCKIIGRVSRCGGKAQTWIWSAYKGKSFTYLVFDPLFPIVL